MIINHFKISTLSERTIKFIFDYEETSISFILTKNEILSILLDLVRPFYDDSSFLIQFNRKNIRLLEVYNNYEEYIIDINFEESSKILQYALSKINSSETIDLTREFKIAEQKSLPVINVKMTDEFTELLLQQSDNERFNAYIERVKNIAKNRSNGWGDPVNVGFCTELNGRDAYFSIQKKDELIMNGGIIYDENSKEYGMHT